MSNFTLELTHPWRLLGIVLLPILIYYFYRSLVDFPRWQRQTSLVTRSIIVLLLLLALAGLTLSRPTHEQFVVVCVDRSLSVGEEANKVIEPFLKDAVAQAGANRLAYLPFEMSPGQLSTELKSLDPPPAKDPKEANDPKQADPKQADPKQAAPKKEGTNIAAVVEAAIAAVPPGYVPQVVLVTDGNETLGNALQTVLRAGVPVSTVPLPTRQDLETQISAVNLPAQVRQGEPFFVEVVIDSNHDDEGVIQVFRGDHQVVNEKKTIKKGENRFRFQQSIESERLAAFTAQVSGLTSDALLDNNSASGLIYTAGKPRVLIVESDPKLIRDLVAALEQEEIQVDVRPPTGMPDNLSDLQNYEMLMLSNVPATALSQRQMEIARTYVQDLGGGFMMLGGEQSFGLGGYYKSVLEEVLPVRSDFEKEKEKPGLGMVLVIDKSGSMSGDKMEMAKSAARSAVELLGSKDQIGVVAFDGDTFTISEMQSASNKGRISDDISRIEASGGTTMYPAMERAHEMLQQTTARLKHVIILTDGVSSPGDFAGLAAEMNQMKITVSTVGVGADSATDVLEEVAKAGSGRYYFTDDPANIPQIFAKETVTASKSAIDEQPFVPQVIRATQALKGLDVENAPFLLGYVKTRPKPTCELILATEKGDPLLVWWRYGLGMSAAFTSDAKTRWAAEWLTWPEFAKFWAQIVRHTMRKNEAKGVVVEVEQRGGQAFVTLDAVDAAGRFLNQAETELTLIDPRLGNQKLTLAQTAPGRYTGTVDTPLTGAYHLEIAQKKDGQAIYRQSRGMHVGYSDELRLKPTNEPLLKQLAEVSGGRFAPTAAELFKPTERSALRPTPLWPWLVTIAAVLLVLDVFLRRVDLSLLFGRRPLVVQVRGGKTSSQSRPTARTAVKS
ncbi:FixH family protein [Anatilimnocola floriformis]|uniref:FixH family protein n=1 Tax=Anatilimnocola floriformis TaxID=2948575 RepID=UPI0020C4132B|nr:FixH family protein [Anatilimnocola floriformis]